MSERPPTEVAPGPLETNEPGPNVGAGALVVVKPTDDHEVRAWHEAGHAVMAHIVGGRFRYITMRSREPGVDAHVQSVRTRSRLDMARVLVAGSVVEAAITCVRVAEVFGGHGARDLITAVEYVEMSQLRALVWDVDQTLGNVGHVGLIQTVANALMARSALSYAEFRSLADGAEIGVAGE